MTKTKKLVLTSLFAALTCVATMIIRIPTPMNGYLNLGDALVLISGYTLGPWLGAVAGGLGSMLADIFAGYAVYAPATLVIKAAVAAVGASLEIVLPKKLKINYILSALIAECIMVGGYFAFECFILGEGIAAAVSIPGNIFQGIAGIIISSVIMSVVKFKNIQ